MTPTVPNVLVALLWGLIASAAVWLVTWPLRRRSVAWLLASVVLTGAAASIGAVLGGVHSMLLPMNSQITVVVVAVAAGIVAVAAALAAARRLGGENAVLQAALTDVAEGRVPDQQGPRLVAELEVLRRRLTDTAQALAETREREHALESSRRELVSWVSHDLRTPLAGLRAMAEALEDGVAGDDPQQYYKQIAAAVDRLSGMVDDLFDLSRIQAGSVARERDRLELGDLVSDTVAALQPLAAAQGVRLTGHVAHRVAVTGSARELNRAVTNLVANAVRHTPEGGVVDARVGLVAAGDNSGRFTVAEVAVRDGCGGIPAADLPRLFDVGYRGTLARSVGGPHAAGAGLGLAITKGIVEAHAGQVAVENTVDGCCFRVRLPITT